MLDMIAMVEWFRATLEVFIEARFYGTTPSLSIHISYNVHQSIGVHIHYATARPASVAAGISIKRPVFTS